MYIWKSNHLLYERRTLAEVPVPRGIPVVSSKQRERTVTLDDTKNGLVYFSLDEVGDVPSSVYRIENKDVRAPGPVYGSINNPTFEGAFNVAPTQVDVQGDAVVVVDDEYFFGGISLSQANLGTISNAIDALKFEKGKVGEPIAWFALSISYVIIS